MGRITNSVARRIQKKVDPAYLNECIGLGIAELAKISGVSEEEIRLRFDTNLALMGCNRFEGSADGADGADGAEDTDAE